MVGVGIFNCGSGQAHLHFLLTPMEIQPARYLIAVAIVRCAANDGYTGGLVDCSCCIYLPDPCLQP